MCEFRLRTAARICVLAEAQPVAASSCASGPDIVPVYVSRCGCFPIRSHAGYRRN
jgi:hypothetical protein